MLTFYFCPSVSSSYFPSCLHSQSASLRTSLSLLLLFLIFRLFVGTFDLCAWFLYDYYVLFFFLWLFFRDYISQWILRDIWKGREGETKSSRSSFNFYNGFASGANAIFLVNLQRMMGTEGIFELLAVTNSLQLKAALAMFFVHLHVNWGVDRSVFDSVRLRDRD